MLCFVVVMQSFIMNSHEVFIYIHQGCFAGTGAIVRLPQCQWSKPDGYGKISQCITTTKHSKAKTVCIFLGIYCSIVCPKRNVYICVHDTYPSASPQLNSNTPIDYNFNAVDNGVHGLIIHTIRTEAKDIFVEQGGGVRTIQKFGENRNQRNKLV